MCQTIPTTCRLGRLIWELQSSYRKFHSTESALTCLHDDILRAIDGNTIILLIMLGLSGAFDTVDHDVLLERLKSELGICVTALNWFKSYMSGRSQSVLINGTQSKPTSLVCCGSQSQGSVHYLHVAFGWHNQGVHVCRWLSVIHHFQSIWHQSGNLKYGNFDWWHPRVIAHMNILCYDARLKGLPESCIAKQIYNELCQINYCGFINWVTHVRELARTYSLRNNIQEMQLNLKPYVNHNWRDPSKQLVGGNKLSQ